MGADLTAHVERPVHQGLRTCLRSDQPNSRCPYDARERKGKCCGSTTADGLTRLLRAEADDAAATPRRSALAGASVCLPGCCKRDPRWRSGVAILAAARRNCRDVRPRSIMRRVVGFT